ncbi:C6 transcription factor [Parachaetomium inaequale]|uniref:C6 transcription factor n=1 Tax=Parachaetomium inaequale TaxID=2588326 RepID=A0AAN6SKV6_9PEZI|nr:C6 transcription factor [Parachaetomium inaequale]
MSTKVTRACDACRVRKVRCSSKQPCAQCAHLNLTCTFAPAPAKRKPGVRGRLVAQLRNKAVPKASSAGNTHTAATAASPASSTASSLASETSGSAAVTSIAGILDPGHVVSPRFELASAIGGSGYSQDFFMQLLPKYEQLVYPVNPVLTPDEMRDAIANMHASYEDAAVVYAFGAITLNLTQTSLTLHGDIASQMTSLVQASLWAHRKADVGGDPDPSCLQREMPITVKRVMVGMWNECSLMAFKRFDRSFASLRESIAMIQMLNIHQYSEDNPCGLTRGEISRRQRMYWEAYIHERFVCIMSGFPCTMIPLRTGLPITDPDVPPYVTVGFNRLTRLFQVMDAPLLAQWTAQAVSDAPAITAEWIESKQAQLDADEAETADAALELVASGAGALSEEQHVDLFVTRLWLRTLVWQLALSHGLLCSAPPRDAHEGFSLHFPAQRLSAQLRNLVSRLCNMSSIITHGNGILQKLFEITSTVADVLALPRGPGQTQEEARARVEDFLFLVRFMFSFERTQKQHRVYLLEKLEALREMYTVVDFGGLASSPLAE